MHKKFLLLIIISWTFSALWLVLYPGNNLVRWTKYENKSTEQTLGEAKNVINEFIREEKVTPLNISMIRAFSKTKGLYFSPYDSLGQRLQYIRLSDRHFILRSFGKDGIQNTNFKNTDQITGVLIKRPQTAHEFENKKSNSIKSYDPLNLVGSLSPNKKWYAQIYIDRANRKKHLAIRSVKNRNLYMLAPHDNIEEFFWLADSNKIIYTATNSDLYADGIFIWDINKDKLITIIDSQGKNKLGWQSEASQLLISLAGYQVKNSEIYAYIASSPYEQPVSIKEFLSSDNLYSIKYNNINSKISINKYDKNFKNPDFENEFWSLHNSDYILGQRGSPSQRAWRALPFRGNYIDVIKAWEKFATDNIDSPLFFYSNWIIALLYNDSIAVLESENDSNAPMVRGIATDTAFGLANNLYAPTYLRALGHHAYLTFKNGKLLETKIAIVNNSSEELK